MKPAIATPKLRMVEIVIGGQIRSFMPVLPKINQNTFVATGGPKKSLVEALQTKENAFADRTLRGKQSSARWRPTTMLAVFPLGPKNLCAGGTMRINCHQSVTSAHTQGRVYT